MTYAQLDSLIDVELRARGPKTPTVKRPTDSASVLADVARLKRLGGGARG